ncbi:type VI secretion system protein TssA [Paraburkholderia sp. HP33-1]|uniref:type VI secretion system protein TssA n=1 Tax=Paraburkholderia sp. HP33-1 TaxID=2883243 RepID=UPI001F1ACD5A|nr:type VI secretion system protein TssA [Paraburkholderia sp. HP33-1]
MNPIFDIEALLQPISSDLPAGVSLLHDPAVAAIKEARREDDSTLPLGVWQSELKVADWAAVEMGCRTLLIERSKDLMLAAWLGESWLLRHGCTALPVCFDLVYELCARYWETLHPLPRDGDFSYRTAPLEWVERNYPALLEGRIGLCAGPNGSTLTLARWERAQRETVALKDRKDVPAAKREESARAMAELIKAVQAASPAALLDQLQAIGAARAAVEKLNTWCDEALGAEAPGFARTKSTLGTMDGLLRTWLTMHHNWKEDAMVEVAPIQVASASADAAQEIRATAPPGVPQSRGEAYRMLAVIAEYLMRYEPHSPVPYMLKRAVDWGGKPLPELLMELMAGENGRALAGALGLLPEGAQ